MGSHSKIQWTHHTHNAWRGCRKVSAECANCYIVDTMPFRTIGQMHGPMRVRASEATRREPHRWNASAAGRGVRDENGNLTQRPWWHCPGCLANYAI
jgi:protein gp37